jgi:radical SAM superfamily enzyme YgiQ (UPF0313 family)
LGGALEREGVDVTLEDLSYRLAAGELPVGDDMADAACDALLARGTFDVIGISVMGATLPIALAILERVRARDRFVRTWLGGPGTTGLDRTLLERFACVDAVVRGEGELTVAQLCAASAGGTTFEGIAGVTWRDESGRVRREEDREPIADLAWLAPYAWHLLPPIAAYKRITGAEDGLVPLDSGRGCVYDCSFCTIGRFWSRRSRTLPARLLADEVESLARVPGARAAYLCHDIFGANRGQAIAFCDELERRSVRIPWEVRARADHLDRELLERMGRAGCYRVLIGVESADAAVRERNQKGMRRAIDLLEVVDDCASAGITPILSLILGLPGEDERARDASLDFCARAALRAGVNVSLHLVNPQPGCALGEELGERARPVEGIPPDMALGAGETGPERALIAAHADVFSTFALLPQDEEHLRDLHAIATELPEILMRYPRTFALLRENGDHERGALELYRAWRASARNFETFARAARSKLVDDMLAWEQALVRVAARGGVARARGPIARAIVLELAHDVPAVASGLRAGVRAAREPKTTRLAVVPRAMGAPMKGVETLRISRDVAELLEMLDGTRTRAELAHVDAAIDRLASAGLVDGAREDIEEKVTP